MSRLGRAVKPIAVFLGPSLPRDQACGLLDADYLPPARKGDVYRILASGVKTIVLIDGLFHTTPSVWHRELLDAIEEGIDVVGASSMGALRAAELRRFGMIGCGTVFEWYRDGKIDGDDEVALWHASAEFDFRPLSEPLVNIRATLARAVDDACLTAGQAEDLVADAKRTYYPHRSYRRLLESHVAKGWPRATVGRLKRYLSRRSVDVKKLDAIGALRLAARIRRNEEDRVPQSLPNRKSWWDLERMLSSGFYSKGVSTGADVLARARRDRALVATMRKELSHRRFLLEWARQHGVSCPAEFRMDFARQCEEARRPRDRGAWLASNGLTPAAYESLLAERALTGWLATKGPSHFGLDRSFVLEWARQSGVASPNGRGRRAASDLEAWIVARGPNHFGLDWSFFTDLLRELQMTGRAAEILAQRAAR